MRVLVPILCAALLAMPAPAAGQAMDVETAIKQGTEAWMAAWNRGDAAGIAALYTEDAMVAAPGAEPASGRAAIKALLETALKASPGSKMSIKPLEIMKGDGWAVETGSFVESAADGSHRDHGRYTAVWKKVGNTWMLHRDIWNSSM